MKKVLALCLLLLSYSFGGLYEDKTIGENISINAFVNCTNETVIITSNESVKAYLIYGSLVLGSGEGKRISIAFFGKIPNITMPFTLKIEKGENQRFITFWIDECKTVDLFYLVNEIEERHEENIEYENETRNESINTTYDKSVEQNISNQTKLVENTSKDEGVNSKDEQKENSDEKKVCLLSTITLLLGLIKSINK